MDRYQFEDDISEYIENNLSIAKRKEFEQYLSKHPEAKDQVNSVRSTIKILKSLPSVKTSSTFNDHLRQKLSVQRDVKAVPQRKPGPNIFGFTPLTAGMMAFVLIAIVFVGIELIPSRTSSSVAIPQQTVNNNLLPIPTKSTPIQSNPRQTIASDLKEDSTATENDLNNNNPNFEDKINYVKTQ